MVWVQRKNGRRVKLGQIWNAGDILVVLKEHVAIEEYAVNGGLEVTSG
jgi:hypothetical protein